MQNSSKNWYAVYTRPKWEKKVAQQLARKKIDCYCPLKLRSQWNDRKKVISEPLFSSYVFAYLQEREQLHARQINGVIGFAHWLNKPAVISNEDIDTIKSFLNDFPSVRLEKTRVNQHDHARIISEPLMMREGHLLEVRVNILRVNLPSLGYVLVADVKRENVETINPLRELIIDGKVELVDANYTN